ncbi:MAG: hypothetical protein OXI92_08795 [Acidobacteriota bacterium]|nr:hypothetical protein [Acidobacteriota bacterium]
MNLMLHIMEKDFRCLWRFLIPFWGLLVFHAVLIQARSVLGPSPSYEGSLFLVVALTLLLSLVGILKICWLAVIVSRLVHQDSTAGSTAFWLSRPLSGGRLLLSKSLFLGMTVISPHLLLESAMLGVHGVTLYDIFRSIPQMALPALLVTLLLMMLASLTSDLARMMLLGVLAMVAWYLASSALTELLPVFTTRGWIPPGAGSGWMAPFLPPLAIAGAVVGRQYLARGRAVSGRLAFLVMFLTLLVVEFSQGFLGWVKHGLDRENRLSGQVSARVEKGSLAFERVPVSDQALGLSEDDSEPEQERRIFLKGRIVLENFPPDLCALPGLVSARLALPSGEPLATQANPTAHWYAPLRHMADPWPHFSVPSGDELDVLGQVLGEVRFLNAPGDGSVHPWVDLFGVSQDLHERYGGVGIAYSARVDFLLLQAEVTAVLPLKRGAVRRSGSDRTEILWIGGTGRGLTVELKETVSRVAADGWAMTTHVLRNPSTREVWLGGGDGTSVSNQDGLAMLPGLYPAWIPPSLHFLTSELRFRLPEGSPPLPETWLQGAELVRIETTQLGVMSKTVRIDDLVMERIPVGLPDPE